MNTTTVAESLELEIIPRAPADAMQLAVQQPQSPMAMMMQATAQGMSPDTLERMWALQVKFEEHNAKKAYVEDMAAFKKNPPKILKDKHVNYANKSGGETDYDHATHYGVTSAIIAGLSLHGFSHAWVPDQIDGKVGVTCTLTHKLGHSESVRLEASPDASGGKNSIQAVISAKTYLERHTLLAITGLSTADQPDDDGRAAGGAVAAQVADAMLAQLHATRTDAEAAAVWATGSKAIYALNIPEAYSEFKAAVVEHRRMLKGKAS